MKSPYLLHWVSLAFFGSLAVGFSAPEADTGEAKTVSAQGTAATASPTPKPTPDPDEEEEQEIRRNHRLLGEPARTSPGPQTKMFVGREVAVPTQYAAPRITQQPDGNYVVQPATPTAFETRRTGVTIDTTGIEETELEGFIDYGSPIRTAVPLYNEKGEIIGTTIQDHPNPILQPVFRTIRKE